MGSDRDFLSAELGAKEFKRLSRLGESIELDRGDVLVAEGDLADHFYILLEGELEALPRQAAPRTYMRGDGDRPLLIGAVFMRRLEATRACRLVRVGADEYLQDAAGHSPANGVIIRGLIWRFRTTEALVHQNEKLASLGKLAAGLTHELNNPAAAGRRAAAQLRAELSRLYAVITHLSEMSLDNAQMRQLIQLPQARGRHAAAMLADPVGQVDEVETVGGWLAEHRIDDAWDLAPRLVEAGMTPASLATFTDGLAAETICDALNWIGSVSAVGSLLETIEVCTEHIFELVGAVKAYAYLDRAPSQNVNVIEGIESTLVILRHRLGRIRLHREFAEDLPRIWAHGSELTQVWTNLLANAIDALDGEGNIWIRTSVEGEYLAVEIADDGPGIPTDIRPRIFEPFFTTKDTRHAAGLGLDLVYSIVVRRHSGAIQVSSEPGDTRFRVLIPLHRAAAADVDSLRPVTVEQGIS